jgi:hypothetical protein
MSIDFAQKRAILVCFITTRHTITLRKDQPTQQMTLFPMLTKLHGQVSPNSPTHSLPMSTPATGVSGDRTSSKQNTQGIRKGAYDQTKSAE